jgi:3,4-dihydroxy-9,10-secoandrosta-1,3,5(10)-triene-9,17-dione 4,5-dioxygenase
MAAPPSHVRALGYVRLTTPNLERWEHFATSILGMMPVDGTHEGSRCFRIDKYPYRVELVPGDEKGVAAVGFEVGDDHDLASVSASLREAGIVVDEVSEAEARERLVSGLARFVDPSGVNVELFFGPILDHVRVQTPLVSGFVTGDMGMGHVVLGVSDLAASSGLFRDVLGFHRRNTMRVDQPMPDGTTNTLQMDFLGCNPRHHTLGLVGVPFPGQIVHFMLEVSELDDVGRALDRVHAAEIPLSLTLGRHTNDHMVSFYVTSPDGYSVEFGWGGLQVGDVASETTYEITKPSFWGHQRPKAAAS